ncbi:diguanylate cyclase/phosphodiesterase (GGDEF & EAL domains) with PAS/PAC sensor(s) [hydrothermal vent metagenome]|uniref:Diguanylate cyclase/phosphodiesterase (GGDEF & EAL domains) with PAS/PAC sensor(S) n=1 Tax=hydrothermal vent metagenome TaxID=652676 RepID=A0A3B0Z2E3_9ZZZZ
MNHNSRIETILIVDDAKINIEALNTILCNDYRVLFATNGAMAINIAKNQKPDLILLDVIMPAMDGYQVCIELKSDLETQDIPIIFITSKNSDEDEEMGFQLGAVDYLTKPVRPATVKLRVHNQLQIRHSEDLILHQALYDSLTRLPNRALVLDRLKQILVNNSRGKTKTALFFIDLDDFKKINDTLGHNAGDQVLIAYASRLQQCVRDGDTVGRLGGDEFVIILPSIANHDVARTIAEKILEAFNQPIAIAIATESMKIVLTASIGIAISPDDGTDPKILLTKSDTAMYQSKQNGRNTYHFFTKTMNDHVQRRLELESHLRQAVNKKELVVHYQPIIDIPSRSPIGAEALLRWKNPILGNIPPNEFISLAEQTDLIDEIGQFVLHDSCQNFQRLQQQTEKPLFLAVNVSPLQFRKNDFCNIVKKTLENTHFPADLLEIELTESLSLSKHNNILETLESLCQHGIRISIDDFGTGYSSLSTLRKFPFTIVKIDRSFIVEIYKNKEDQVLVHAIISMAHALNLKVIAEGVETEEQFAFLKAENCDMAQGFLFSEAQTIENFSAYLNTQIKKSQ